MKDEAIYLKSLNKWWMFKDSLTELLAPTAEGFI